MAAGLGRLKWQLVAWSEHPAARILGLFFLLKDSGVALLSIAGLFVGFKDDPVRFGALVIGIVGLLCFLIPILRGRRTLRGHLRMKQRKGERLLLKARKSQTFATAAGINAFIERDRAWVKGVTALLLFADEREMLDKWARVAPHRGRPQPGDSLEAEQLLASPISQRLAVLEEFCRDR